jgi:hypothetical protein
MAGKCVLLQKTALEDISGGWAVQPWHMVAAAVLLQGY